MKTKKKVMVDQDNSVAKFGEKITLKTTLNKQPKLPNGHEPKIVALKLYANYSGKDKAIGIA